MLSPLTDLTGGEIIKLNPINLNNEFADVLAEKLVATSV